MGCDPKISLLTLHATIAYALESFASLGIFTQNATECGELPEMPGNIALAYICPSNRSAPFRYPCSSCTVGSAILEIFFNRAAEVLMAWPRASALKASPFVSLKDQCTQSVGGVK